MKHNYMHGLSCLILVDSNVFIKAVASEDQQLHGGHIFIYSCLSTVRQSILKEIDETEHECMNMSP